MPKMHSDLKLKELLESNGIPLNDAVKRGEFYQNYFDWDSLAEKYKEGNSIRDISKLTGLSYDAVRINLIRVLGELRPFNRKGQGSYTFNDYLFFPRITNIGAYFLGWLYSDGCITHDKITFTQQWKDKSHIDYLAGLVSNKPCRNAKNGREFNYFSVDLTQKFMKVYNVLPNKSHRNYKIPLDRFTKESLPYLLLGLFEGDGSVSKNLDCSMLLPSNTWEELRKIIPVDLSKVSATPLNKYGLLNIYFRGNSYFDFSLYVYTLTDEVIPLRRKFERFIIQCQRSAMGRTSPYKHIAKDVWDSLNQYAYWRSAKADIN